MTDREKLEARAKELELKFPANIGDEKLAARIAKAEAAATPDDTSDGSADQTNAPADGAGDAPVATPPAQKGKDDKAVETGETNTDEDAPAPATDEDQTGDAGEETAPEVNLDEQVEAVWRINCLVAGGRRRAGERWAGGVTDVLVAELTEDQLKSLDADPMFTVHLIEPKE